MAPMLALEGGGSVAAAGGAVAIPGLGGVAGLVGTTAMMSGGDEFEGPPTAASEPKPVGWTPHNGKHVPPKRVPWKDIVEGTTSGPAKYKPGLRIEALERGVWETGTPVTTGKPWKVQEFQDVIGASEGKPSRWVRVEETKGTIHGHPISHAEFKRLTR